MAVASKAQIDPGSLIAYGTVAAVLVYVLVLPLVRFAFRPYASTARALQGPPIRHWLAGSWSADVYTNGRVAHEVQQAVDDYGPVCAVTTLGRKTTIILGDHKAANKVFLQTPYARSQLRVSILRRHVGRGLLTEEGETHRRQRKVANPAFTANAVLDMGPIFQEKTALFMDRLHRHVAADGANAAKFGTLKNIAHDFQKVTLDIIGKAGFGYEFNSLTKEGETTALQEVITASMGLVSTGTLYSALRIFLDRPVTALGRILRVKEQVELDQHWKSMEKLCLDIVQRAKEDAQREDSSTTARDVLSLMVRSNVSPDVKPSQRMSIAELMHTIPVLLAAGHETTSSTLSFVCHELFKDANGARVQQRIRSELQQDAGAAAQGWVEDAAQLNSLPYLEAVVRETLRLCGPIRRMSRDAPCDDVIPISQPITLRDGTKTDRIRVSKGQGIEFPVQYMNTCEELWGPDGKVFRPERWLSEGHKYHDGSNDMDPSVNELKGVYSHLLTFGAGSQMCIGYRLAILEMKYILASLLSSYELLPPNLPGEPPVQMGYLTPITAYPVVQGEEAKGPAMPLRLRPIAASA
ncbi:hypothetical protein CF319_g5483 [Tilletia indica]|nr:hypothetical protein CF319_g5483 [Tilletia indica]